MDQNQGKIDKNEGKIDQNKGEMDQNHIWIFGAKIQILNKL